MHEIHTFFYKHLTVFLLFTLDYSLDYILGYSLDYILD